MSTPIISIRNITKAFPGVKAVDDVSLDIRQNEFFALLGPSGCGKTTLLRMIAGLETPTSGEILLDGQDMVRVPPNKRPINMVFQSYAVFPHMTVAENIAYGLKVTGVPKSEIGPRVEESLATAHLTHLAHRKPDQLSGGQRQRVALARALIKRPKVLLLDEPLSALDAKLRDQMRSELARLQVSVGITFIIVTHDQEEALSMADRIAVMDAGKVQQVAPPDVLYESPATRFVADFIGKVNLYEATVKGRDGERLVVETNGLGTIALPVEKAHQGNVTIAIRPEKLHVTKHRPETARVMFEGEVTEVSYFGDSSHVMVKTPAGTLLNANIQNVSRRVGCDFDTSDKVWVTMDPEDILVLAS